MSDIPSISDSVRALLEGQLSRRKFMKRMSALGFAASAGTVLADVVLAQDTAGPDNDSRQLGNLTGGELTAEFLIDLDVQYIFGLGGSEAVGFLASLVDKPDLQYILSIH